MPIFHTIVSKRKKLSERTEIQSASVVATVRWFFSMDLPLVLVYRINLHTSKCWKGSDDSGRERIGNILVFLFIPVKKKLIFPGFDGQAFCMCDNRFPFQESLPR